MLVSVAVLAKGCEHGEGLCVDVEGDVMLTVLYCTAGDQP